MAAILPHDLAGLALMVFLLGLRHGMDPDHLATIDGLARYNGQNRPRVARWSGCFFSLGHGAIVTLVAAFVAASLAIASLGFGIAGLGMARLLSTQAAAVLAGAGLALGFGGAGPLGPRFAGPMRRARPRPPFKSPPWEEKPNLQ